ncbi:MAG: M48 family metallopeptidase [Deltaproteobacteria bacterium]|nr:M48 family metallopeptidase [Deltaproteobacteria bacterium]
MTFSAEQSRRSGALAPAIDFAARQQRNRRVSVAIVLGFIGFFLLVGFSVDYVYLGAFAPRGPSLPWATLGSLAFATFMTLTAYGAGSKMILSSMNAEPLDRKNPQHRELHNVVTEMALASGSAMPKVYVVYDAAANAFATGRDEKSAAICVTTGLLVLLDREETQGVVAHEMAHIKNNDTVVMMLISILLGGIALLADWAQRSYMGSRSGRKTGANPLLVIPALLLIVLSPLISRLLAMAVSRQRELLADATAVEFTRNPIGLAKALEKIRDAGMPFQKATRGTAHLFIASPFRRRLDERDGRWADLLSTHPPIEQRIQLLHRMAGAAAPMAAPQEFKGTKVQDPPAQRLA